MYDISRPVLWLGQRYSNVWRGWIFYYLVQLGVQAEIRQSQVVHRVVTPSHFHNLQLQRSYVSISAALLLKVVVIGIYGYRHFLPCRHLAISATPLIWRAAKSPAKIIDFIYYELSITFTDLTNTCSGPNSATLVITDNERHLDSSSSSSRIYFF